MSSEEAEKRLNSQISNEERCSKADVVIHNSGSIEKLQQEAREVYESFSS